MSNFYVSEKFWKKLSDQHKRVIKDAAMQAVTTFDGLTLWGESLWVDYFRGEGLEVYTPTASEMKIWKDTVHEHMIDWTKKKIGPEWVDKMLKASEQAEKELYSF
jgi:TRAP-type C4-dicarboxylate transport system substrate-binding protein